MDRGTKCYDRHTQFLKYVHHLQKNYHFSTDSAVDGGSTFLPSAIHVTNAVGQNITSRRRNGVEHCLTSTDSSLEAFTCNPADGSFAALGSRGHAFTVCIRSIRTANENEASFHPFGPREISGIHEQSLLKSDTRSRLAP